MNIKMSLKYWNQEPPKIAWRLPKWFYLDNWVPRVDNIILPSQESVDRILLPIVNSWTYQGIKMLLSDVKAAIVFTVTEGFLSPFPALSEIKDTELLDVVDFVVRYKSGIKNPYVHRDILEMQDFLSVPGSQIYPEYNCDKSIIFIKCYRNGVYHNQEFFFFFSHFILNIAKYNNEDPFYFK